MRLNAQAAPPTTPAEALAASLRELVIGFLPDPLFEDRKHWGLQQEMGDHIHWKGQGIHVHPVVVKEMKNHGHWWMVRITAPQMAKSLLFDIRDVIRPEPEKTTFNVFISFECDLEYDKQTWRRGVRTYAGSVRARLRVLLTLKCEMTTRTETTAKLLPDTIFRLRVTDSNLAYDNLVVEHVPGIGGEAARILGDAVHAGMTQWKPSLERNLIAKVNAAIVKAGDTKDVRIGLTSLLGKK
jgi:hypothetical protein